LFIADASLIIHLSDIRYFLRSAFTRLKVVGGFDGIAVPWRNGEWISREFCQALVVRTAGIGSAQKSSALLAN